MPKFFYMSYWATEPVYYVLLIELVPHAVISDWSQFSMEFCASCMARSCLVFEMKTKSDVVICGQLIVCLGLHLDVCYHVIVT